MNLIILSQCLLLLCIINKGLAIDCYKCESNSDIECGEKFDEDNTKLRPESCEHVHEAKFCIKATGMFEGQIGTKRFCSSRDYGDYCNYVRRVGDERDYRSCVFTCSSDGCNTSLSRFRVSFHLKIALIVLIIISIHL